MFDYQTLSNNLTMWTIYDYTSCICKLDHETGQW